MNIHRDENNANNSLTAGCSPLYSVRLVMSDWTWICKYTLPTKQTSSRISHRTLQVHYSLNHLNIVDDLESIYFSDSHFHVLLTNTGVIIPGNSRFLIQLHHLRVKKLLHTMYHQLRGMRSWWKYESSVQRIILSEKQQPWHCWGIFTDKNIISQALICSSTRFRYRVVGTRL